jgi:hypothetical protein
MDAKPGGVPARSINGSGTIVVTVAMTEGLPAYTPIYIYAYIHDHADTERGSTAITFQRGPSIYLAVVLRNTEP